MTKLDAWVWKTNMKKDGWFQGIYPCSVMCTLSRRLAHFTESMRQKVWDSLKSSLPNIVCILASTTHFHPRGYISEETGSTLRVNVFSTKVLLGTLLLGLLLEMGPPFEIVIAEKRQCLHFSVILRLWVSALKCSTKWANPAAVKKKTSKTPLPSSLNNNPLISNKH